MWTDRKLPVVAIASLCFGGACSEPDDDAIRPEAYDLAFDVCTNIEYCYANTWDENYVEECALRRAVTIDESMDALAHYGEECLDSYIVLTSCYEGVGGNCFETYDACNAEWDLFLELCQ